MYKNAKPLFLICETPLHVGSGSDLGIIDLPIQRERHTNFPKIESSSFKGAMRESFESAKKADEDFQTKIHRTFGFDEASASKTAKDFFGNDTQFSGSLSLTDARLLLFPVKSLYGVFAWITCPRVIKKFIADLQLTDVKFDFTEISKATVANGATLFDSNGATMQLEEFVFKNISKATADNEVNKLGNWLSKALFNDNKSYWSEKIKTDIVVLDDNDFRDFVTLATEVITRTKIDNNTGTVHDGALFSEEYLPAESIMYSLAMFADEFTGKADKMTADKVLTFFESGLTANNNIMQIGANATLGKGIVKTKLVKEVQNG